MIVTYKSTDDPIFVDTFTALNKALNARLTDDNNVSNIRDRSIFKSPGTYAYLNKSSVQMDFQRLSLYFKKGKDPAGVYPLQGIEGKTASSATKIAGENTGTTAQVLPFVDFKSILNITSFFTYTTDKSQEVRYGRRILAFYIQGFGNDGVAKNLLLKSPSDPVFTTDNVTLENLQQNAQTFNLTSGSYQVGFTTQPINLSLAMPTTDSTRVLIPNIIYGNFTGRSCRYINSFGIQTAWPNGALNFDPVVMRQIDFNLNFEKIASGIEGSSGTYEISFQATNSARNLKVVESGSTFSLSIPSGISSAKSDLFTYTETDSRKRELEKSRSIQANEKLSLNLPQTFYQLVDFTNQSFDNIFAKISIYQIDETAPPTQILVPYGKKIILCNNDNDVVKNIIENI